MPPEQPQIPLDPNQHQSTQPQPNVSQAPSSQQPAPSSDVPSSWNTLFILSLILDVLTPLIGVILGEVLYSKAKAAGNDAWRKKAKWAIYFGCLVIVIALAFAFGRAFIAAKHDASSGADYSSPAHSSKDGLPNKTQAELITASIDYGIEQYYGNQNSAQQKGWKLTFPTLAQLNDPTWRQANGVDFSKAGGIPASDAATISFISGTPTKPNQYGYKPSPAGCDGSQANPCIDYVLTAATTSGLYTENTADENIH